jgi:hypothetical protein
MARCMTIYTVHVLWLAQQFKQIFSFFLVNGSVVVSPLSPWFHFFGLNEHKKITTSLHHVMSQCFNIVLLLKI